MKGDLIDQVAQEVLARIRRGESNAGRAGTMMKIEEVAARWDLNVKTVYAMIERGELPARRLGRVLRIPRHVVESFEQASVAQGGNKCL
jgi:excisionase family DNA binding protein